MPTNIDLRDIQQALGIARIEGFTREYTPLGGGEVNNTYKLDLDEKQIILRIAKDEGQDTLKQEARALRLLDLPNVPKLIFFDEVSLVKNRLWILESYLPGVAGTRLTVEQLNSLGNLLAQVHKVPASGTTTVNLREQFLDVSKAFGDEQTLLNHPDQSLKQLIRKAYNEFKEKQPFYDSVRPTLIHQDATPSNILVDGDNVGLIDWEFSKFNDPMADFSTIYYEDMEYNQGKWRIQIRPDEKSALFSGYEAGGGRIDEDRIRFWIRFDKLGAAVFLYWRLHESTRETDQPQAQQYQLDYNNLLASLSK